MATKFVPTHTNWKALKKKHEVSKGAVRGVNVGKLLDAYHRSVKSGVQHSRANSTAAEALEKGLARYISKVEKKDVEKDFSAFKRTFLEDYVGAANFFKEDFKRYKADADTYRKELVKFVHAVTKLKPNATTVDDLNKFKSGPLRGLSAVGSSLKFDLSDINKVASRIQKIIEKTPAAATPELLEKIRGAISEGTVEIAKAAKKLGLM